MKQNIKKSIGILDWIYKPQSELYKRINFTRHIILTGFLKSTSETSLLIIGFNIIFYSVIAPQQYKDYAVFVGIIALMAGVLVDFVGDRYIMQKKDEQFQITESLMDEKITEQAVTEKKAREIAKKLIENEMSDIEDALCNDNPDSLCNKKEKE
jgi:hypothetical protein